MTGGIDYDWRIGQRWGLNGYWAGSSVSGSTEAIDQLQRSNVHSFQRPDADHVEFDPLADTLRGHSGMVSFGKIAGERTRMNVNVGYKSPGFDVNDLGSSSARTRSRRTAGSRSDGRRRGSTRGTSTSISTSGRRSTSTATACELGGNINAHWDVQEFLASRRRRQSSTRGPSTTG